MKKKHVIYLSILAMVAVPAILSYSASYTPIKMAKLIFMPIKLFFDMLTSISIYGEIIGIVFAWLLLIAVIGAPLGLLYLFDKPAFRKEGVSIGILQGIVLFLTIIYFNSSLFPLNLDPATTKIVQFHYLASIWYLSILVIIYKVFLKSYPSIEYAQTLFTIIIGLIIAGYVGMISNSIFVFSEASAEGSLNFSLFVNFIAEILYKVIWIIFLNKVFNVVSQPWNNWFSKDSQTGINGLKKSSRRLVMFSIYFPLTQLIFKYLSIKDIRNIELSIGFPILELVVAILVSLFIHIMSYGTEIKSENEMFI